MRDRPAVPTVGHAAQAEYLSGDAQDVSRAVHGGAAKAVYGYPLEHYAFWREELEEELPLGAFGENLTVEGLPLETEIAVGDRLRSSYPPVPQ